MGNPSEIGALKASFRGALAAAGALGSHSARVETLDASGDVDPAMLEELRRAAVALAIASSALRGLLDTMIGRREGPA